jgi:histone H3/H4
MAWVIKQLNISEDLNLTEPGVTVSIIPTVWLPEAVMMKLMRQSIRMAALQSKMSGVGEGMMELTEEEKQLPQEEQDRIYVERAERQFGVVESAFEQMQPIVQEYLKEIVTDWNIKDEHGEILPIPRVLIEQSRAGEIDKLPLQLKMHLVQAAQDQDEANVPLANEKQSEDSSMGANGTSSAKELSIVSNS